MKRKPTAVVLTVALLAAVVVLASAANRGPETIDIFGGQSGKVHFPHAQHQNRIQDCNVCHSVFPQKADAIRSMKEQGTLKAKQVMNLQCIKCHKQEKQAGKPSGPVTCKSCHVK